MKMAFYDDLGSELSKDKHGSDITSNLIARYTVPRGQLEQEKRMRRQIANSNERKRMQNINSGFQSLVKLLPITDHEKLSKAAILQQAVDHILTLEREKQLLQTRNARLARMLSGRRTPSPKRKKYSPVMMESGVDDDLSLVTSVTDDLADVEEWKKQLRVTQYQLELANQARRAMEEQLQTWIRVKGTDVASGKMESEKMETTGTRTEGKVAWSSDPEKCQCETGSCFAPIETTEVKPSATQCWSSSSPRIVLECLDNTTAVQQTYRAPLTTFGGSMSRRNLETIVEAIRHLEGDGVLVGSSESWDTRRVENGLVQCSDQDEDVCRVAPSAVHSAESKATVACRSSRVRTSGTRTTQACRVGTVSCQSDASMVNCNLSAAPCRTSAPGAISTQVVPTGTLRASGVLSLARSVSVASTSTSCGTISLSVSSLGVSQSSATQISSPFLTKLSGGVVAPQPCVVPAAQVCAVAPVPSGAGATRNPTALLLLNTLPAMTASPTIATVFPTVTEGFMACLASGQYICAQAVGGTSTVATPTAVLPRQDV